MEHDANDHAGAMEYAVPLDEHSPRDTSDVLVNLARCYLETHARLATLEADLKGLGRGAFVVNGGGAVNLLDEAHALIEKAHAAADRAEAERDEWKLAAEMACGRAERCGECAGCVVLHDALVTGLSAEGKDTDGT